MIKGDPLVVVRFLKVLLSLFVLQTQNPSRLFCMLKNNFGVQMYFACFFTEIGLQLVSAAGVRLDLSLAVFFGAAAMKRHIQDDIQCH